MPRFELPSAVDAFVLPASTPQSAVWVCESRAHALTAAFELHERAVQGGLTPGEATTVSLVVAELATSAVKQQKAAVATVTLGEGAWRVEVTHATPQLGAALECVVTSLRACTTAQGEPAVVAEYRRARYG